MSNITFCQEYSHLLQIEPSAMMPIVTRLADLLFSFSGDKRDSAESFLRKKFSDSDGVRIAIIESVDEQIFMNLRRVNGFEYDSFYMGDVPSHYRGSYNVTFFFR